MKASNILETIGNTPHIRINRLFGDGAEVWVKSERANPGASIKDRIALSMVEDAEAGNRDSSWNIAMDGGLRIGDGERPERTVDGNMVLAPSVRVPGSGLPVPGFLAYLLRGKGDRFGPVFRFE